MSWEYAAFEHATVCLASSKTPCLLLLDVFSSVCALHVPLVLFLPCSCLLYVLSINICSVVEPIGLLSVLCQCRNDICRGTLFRPLQFFCKVRYVNWPPLPFQRSCMCCMCSADHIIHSTANPDLLLTDCCLLTSLHNQTLLGQCWLKQIISACLQFCSTIDHFKRLKSFGSLKNIHSWSVFNVSMGSKMRDWLGGGKHL